MTSEGPLPLRLAVPLLLVLGMASMAVAGARLDRSETQRIVGEGARTLLRAELVRVTQSIETLEREGGPGGADDEIALIATEADCEIAFLVREDGVVHASTRLDMPGRAVGPERLPPHVRPSLAVLERAKAEQKPIVEILPDDDAIVGIAPVLLPIVGTLRGTTRGFLVEVRDLRVRRAVALERESTKLVSYGIAAALLATSFLLFFHLSFGRRASALVDAARRFARGEYAARSNVRGRDELAMVGQAFDLMARDVQAKQGQLEESERRYRTLFDASGDGIFIATSEGYIVDVNARGLELAGRTREELVGKRLEALMRPSEPAKEQLLLEHVRVDETTIVEQNLVRKDERRLVVEVSARRLPSGLVQALTRDITERKRLSEELARTERLASVGTLAAGVAHEINNPLTYMAANCELAVKALEPRRAEPGIEEVITLLEEAREGADRVTTVVKDLRGITAAREGALVPVDLVRVVRMAVKLSAMDARHRARVETDLQPVPQVLGSEAQLGQVVVNLVINAAQAFKEPGNERNLVTVRTTRRSDEEVALEVIDNGPGIPPEVEARIFEPFFTTKPVGQGTGLGLFVCERIVTAHGGSLKVETEVGRGTTMRVVLPALGTMPAAEEGTAPREASRRLRVLVVDDVPLVRRLAERALAAHEVTAVGSGAEALARCMESDFDVILSDLMMPGMSGMELHARLVEIRPELAARMLFMSGGAVTDEAVEFLQRFVDRIIEKPATLATIQRAVETAGRARRAPKPA